MSHSFGGTLLAKFRAINKPHGHVYGYFDPLPIIWAPLDTS